MTKRKLFKLFVTSRAVADAIKSGCQTSKDVAEEIGAHRVTVQKKMQDMHAAGLLIRRKIGQTYFYAVMDGVEIPEDTTEADRAELAKKIKDAKQTKAVADTLHSVKGSGRCRILKAHKAAVGDDPERLTTNDILKFMGDEYKNEDDDDGESDFFGKIKKAKRK